MKRMSWSIVNVALCNRAIVVSRGRAPHIISLAFPITPRTFIRSVIRRYIDVISLANMERLHYCFCFQDCINNMIIILRCDGWRTLVFWFVTFSSRLTTIMTFSSAVAKDTATLPRTERMRQSTKKVHDHSTSQLKLGLILTSKPLYAETLSLFGPIYASLEEALERYKDHEQLGQLYPLLPDIQRATGFQKDIEFYQHENHVRPPEVDDYVNYLKTLPPAALLAYVYHMYMAIFAGGFIMKKIVAKSMKLSSDEGVQAFCFEADPKRVRDTLKEIINNTSLTDEEEALLMEEGPNVFLRNDALMEAVKRGEAFQEADADCSRLLTKITVAVLVVAVAVGVALMQSKS